MFRTVYGPILAIVFLGVWSPVVIKPLQADFVFNVSTTVLDPSAGSTATVDVRLISTPPNTSFLVSAFEFKLSIDNRDNPASLLKFIPAPTNAPQLSSISDYIFSSRSNLPLERVSEVNASEVQFSDFLTSGAPVDVSAGKLVGRFTVGANSSAPPVAGNSFSVSVTPVEILDSNLARFTGAVQSSSGTITVANVPEPSSLMGIWTTAFLGHCWCRRSRKIIN